MYGCMAECFLVSVYPCIIPYVILYVFISPFISVYHCISMSSLIQWWPVRPPEKDPLHSCTWSRCTATQVLSAQQLKDRLLQEIDLDELEEGLDPEDRLLGFDAQDKSDINPIYLQKETCIAKHFVLHLRNTPFGPW